MDSLLRIESREREVIVFLVGMNMLVRILTRVFSPIENFLSQPCDPRFFVSSSSREGISRPRALATAIGAKSGANLHHL